MPAFPPYKPHSKILNVSVSAIIVRGVSGGGRRAYSIDGVSDGFLLIVTCG